MYASLKIEQTPAGFAGYTLEKEANNKMPTNNHDVSQARRNFYAAFGLTDGSDESYDELVLDEIFARADRLAGEYNIDEGGTDESSIEPHARSRARKERKVRYYKSIAHRFIVSMMIVGAILGAYVSCTQMIRFYGPIGTDASLFAAFLITAVSCVVVAVLLGVASHIAITTMVSCLQAELRKTDR